MTNSTETFWDIDGVSLQTYAYNITTLGGDRMAPPAVRGADIVVPYLPGTVFTPKVADKRVITLGMWVAGASPDGSIPTDEVGRRTVERNWTTLRNLLWRYRKQFVLTKRFWVPTADLVAAGVSLVGLPVQGAWSLIRASAMASFATGLMPVMTGQTRATFTVDLLLSDPYFYGDPIVVPFPTPALQTIHVLGDERTTDITLDYVGPLTAPQFTLPDYDYAPWLRLDLAALGNAGVAAQVTVKNYAATTHTVQNPVALSSVSGYVSHFGDPAWLYLDPGPTDVVWTRTSGAGTATLTYRPAFL